MQPSVVPVSGRHAERIHNIQSLFFLLLIYKNNNCKIVDYWKIAIKFESVFVVSMPHTFGFLYVNAARGQVGFKPTYNIRHHQKYLEIECYNLPEHN